MTLCTLNSSQQGMAASVGNSMVGGTVADLFHADDRGLAMNVFALMIFVGQVNVILSATAIS